MVQNIAQTSPLTYPQNKTKTNRTKNVFSVAVNQNMKINFGVV